MTIGTNSLITRNERTALRTLVERLEKIIDVARIVVFGSRVRGDFHAWSDMDVLVIFRHMEMELKRTVIHIIHDIEIEYDVPVSPALYTMKEYEMNRKIGSTFIKRVEKEGIVLYDSEWKRES